MPPLVEVRDLAVAFDGIPAVRGLSIDIGRGEALGLVGESGCGKSVTWLAALGLLPGKARVTGSVRLGGAELLGAAPAVLDRVRGGRVAMIFQDPASALNPVHRLGRQVREALRLHRGLTAAAAQAEVDVVTVDGRRPRRSGCSTWSASPTRRAGWTPTRMSSRAARTSG